MVFVIREIVVGGNVSDSSGPGFNPHAMTGVEDLKMIQSQRNCF